MTGLAIPTAVDTAIEAQGRIIALREETEANFLELGRLLCDFTERSLHQEMGYAKVNDWLDSRALGIGRSAGHELMNVWRAFGQLPESVRPDLARAGHAKLALTAGQIGDHPEIPDTESAVAYAKEYSYRELRRKFQVPRSETEKVECPTCHHEVPKEKAPWLDASVPFDVETGEVIEGEVVDG